MWHLIFAAEFINKRITIFYTVINLLNKIATTLWKQLIESVNYSLCMQAVLGKNNSLTELIPTFRSLMVQYDPRQLGYEQLKGQL